MYFDDVPVTGGSPADDTAAGDTDTNVDVGESVDEEPADQI